MGYRHSKDEILEAAIEAAVEEGISRLTFGSLARRLGISDRMIVYYFPSKDNLVGEVLAALGERLQTALGGELATPCADHREFVRRVWPMIARPELDRVFALFFEASGLAAAGLEPYRSLAPLLVQAWLDWARGSIAGSPTYRRNEAVAAIAVVDGLLLMRQLAGDEAADRGARALTARTPRRSHTVT